MVGEFYTRMIASKKRRAWVLNVFLVTLWIKQSSTDIGPVLYLRISVRQINIIAIELKLIPVMSRFKRVLLLHTCSYHMMPYSRMVLKKAATMANRIEINFDGLFSKSPLYISSPSFSRKLVLLKYFIISCQGRTIHRKSLYIFFAYN